MGAKVDRRSPRIWPRTGIWSDIQKIECEKLWTPDKPNEPDVVRVQFEVKIEGFKPGGAR